MKPPFFFQFCGQLLFHDEKLGKKLFVAFLSRHVDFNAHIRKAKLRLLHVHAHHFRPCLNIHKLLLRFLPAFLNLLFSVVNQKLGIF